MNNLDEHLIYEVYYESEAQVRTAMDALLDLGTCFAVLGEPDHPTTIRTTQRGVDLLSSDIMVRSLNGKLRSPLTSVPVVAPVGDDRPPPPERPQLEVLEGGPNSEPRGRNWDLVAEIARFALIGVILGLLGLTAWLHLSGA